MGTETKKTIVFVYDVKTKKEEEIQKFLEEKGYSIKEIQESKCVFALKKIKDLYKQKPVLLIKDNLEGLSFLTFLELIKRDETLNKLPLIVLYQCTKDFLNAIKEKTDASFPYYYEKEGKKLEDLIEEIKELEKKYQKLEKE